ncbi:MAG: lipopolysaccharide biosynthesis protein [Sporichthyaceae bacterium]
MRRDLLPLLGPTLLTKAASIPVNAVCLFVTMRTLVGDLGTEAYGFIALIAILPIMLPFADLGLGADVSSAAARSRTELASVLANAFRRLGVAALAVAAGAAVLAALGVWSTVFGLPQRATYERAAAIGVAVFALSVPFGLGHRLLFGIGRFPLALGLQLLAPIANMGVALFLVHVGGANLALLVFVFMATPLLASAVALRVGMRAVGLTVGELREAGRDRTARAAAPRSVALPMTVVTVSLAVLFHTDRLVVSHVEGLSAVVVYSAMAQLFLPASSLLITPGQTLWPYFIRRSADGAHAGARELWALTGLFVAAAAVMGVALAALGPTLTGWMTHGQGRASLLLSVSFGVLLVVNAGFVPFGAYLMDHAGLMFQARCLTAVACLSVPLSILFCHWWGVAGPVIASCIALALCQWVPTIVRMRRTTPATDRIALPPVAAEVH